MDEPKAFDCPRSGNLTYLPLNGMALDAILRNKKRLSSACISRFIEEADKIEIGDEIGHLRSFQTRIENLHLLHLLPHPWPMLPHNRGNLAHSPPQPPRP